MKSPGAAKCSRCGHDLTVKVTLLKGEPRKSDGKVYCSNSTCPYRNTAVKLGADLAQGPKK